MSLNLIQMAANDLDMPFNNEAILVFEPKYPMTLLTTKPLEEITPDLTAEIVFSKLD